VTAIAIPQLISQRRLLRSAGVAREIVTQLRFARQQAMTQRQAFTFEYDNVNKQIRVIDHNASGSALLTDGAFPMTAGSRVIVTSPLTVGGLSDAEVTYGIPSGFPNAALADGVSKTDLTNGFVRLTFQPDGSVVDATGNPVDRAIFLYDNKTPKETATAISVIGSAGRIKVWKYAPSTNAYAE
jgi:Tfp pilus assembly protein FimT